MLEFRSFLEMENIGNSGVSGNLITSKYTYLGNSPEFQVVLELCEQILTIWALVPSEKMWNAFVERVDEDTLSINNCVNRYHELLDNNL